MNRARAGLAGSRLDRLAVQIGGPSASIKGQWPVLLVSLAAVFACFYALGRLVNSGAEAPVEAPASLQATKVNAAIPLALSGSSPIAGAVPVAIAPAPTRRPRARSLPSTTGLSASTFAPTLTATPVRASAPLAESKSPSAAPEAVRTKASAPSRPSSSSPSGGTAFDSSE